MQPARQPPDRRKDAFLHRRGLGASWQAGLGGLPNGQDSVPEKLITVLKTVLETLAELVQGPCRQNQVTAPPLPMASTCRAKQIYAASFTT